jgi:hypothetical protein
MTRSLGVKVAALLLLICFGSLALAQSMTTALRGKVENENTGLPGVVITLKSPVLQGERTTTTSANGDYAFVGVPPGAYTVTFVLQGFQTVTKTIPLTAGQPATQDAVMSLSGVTTETVVTAKSETVSTTTTASTTYTTDLTNKLPITRTLLSAVNLSAGVAQTAPNGAFVISGANSFDNLFTVDGAVVTDNIRGTPNNLFIEDAIQETTTSVNTISAEFGRFQGGIVNSITKSGGNTFSGSARATLANDAWTALTYKGNAATNDGSFNETRTQKVNPRYEATLGGPLWQDHVWFFGAGRYADSTVGGQTSFTNLAYSIGDTEKRYQGKLTLTPFQNHSVTGNYLKIDRDQGNNSFGVIMDADSLYNRQLPQEIITVNYNGTLSSNFFAEALYSRRKFSFVGSGSRFTDLIKGTLMRDRSRGNARYNSPTFCGVCDPEDRNNRDYLVKGTYFLSTGALGSHNIVLGYDNFAGTRKSNNYQSGSNYRLFTTSTVFQDPVTKASLGDIFPVVDSKSFVYYTPISQLSKGTDALTHSVFLNDQWRMTDRLSFNLGVRWDKNNAANSLGVVTADDSAISPRLAAVFDVTGKGNLRLSASYARYVGGIQDSLLDSSSAGGQPALFYWYYTGPDATPINTNVPAGGTYVTRAQALQQVFNWFFAQGCPDLTTCKLSLAGASVPGLNVLIKDSLVSPSSKEYVLGVNGNMGSAFSFRVDYVHRDFGDFYTSILNTSNGQATDVAGNHYDIAITSNSSDLKRKYDGFQTQLQWRGLSNRLSVTGNWTWSHLRGNFDGENVGSGPITAANQSYPEYKDPTWNNPIGDLAADQRHRIRLLASYDLPFFPTKVGLLNVAVVQAWQSGVPYGAAGAITIRPFVTNPGYVTPPTSSTYYFTSRDAFHTDPIKQTDLAFNLQLRPIGPLEIFIQPQIQNLFNNQGVVAVNPVTGNLGVNTTVLTNRNSSLAAFNPFTTAPVRGVNWSPSSTFGKPQSKDDIQIPRTFLVTAGLRF